MPEQGQLSVAEIRFTKEKCRIEIQKSEIMLYVREVERSRQFWVEKIGLAQVEKRTGPGGSDTVAVRAGEPSLC